MERQQLKTGKLTDYIPVSGLKGGRVVKTAVAFGVYDEDQIK